MRKSLFEIVGMSIGKLPRYKEAKDLLDEKLKQLKEHGVPEEFINELEEVIATVEEVIIDLTAQKAFKEGILMGEVDK